MTAIIGLLSFLGIGVGGFHSLKTIFKKQPKKKALIFTGASFVVMIGALALTPTSPRIDIADKSIETNDQGTAIIEGKTNDQSKITLDGEKIKTNNGEFSYKVTLKDDQPQKLTFVASIGDNDKAETIEVKPSKAFVAFLNEEKQDQDTLKKAETALVLAENKPTKKNYDEAATRITSLTKEKDDFTKRLEIVKENVPIYEAVELAETKQTKEQVDSATALVAKATLNKDSLLKRLTTVQQKITEKEKTEKQIASAREAVEKAEQEPTDDHYN
ncbi:serine protease [Enterococcus ureasiticus]|uniref:serine protease n=1 Tax=Enterococcus ureasiticus TaxID=903984 RepID=UPI001F5E7625|nr:serine protease [Enterococcus ureasiticus]